MNLSTYFPTTVHDWDWNVTATSSLLNINHNNNNSGPCWIFESISTTIISGVICLMGLVLNSLSFFVLNRDKNNEVATFLLKSLAMADNALLASFVLTLTVYFGMVQFPSTLTARKYIYPYLRKYGTPIAHIAMSCSTWTTVLLAVNRFITVCFPFSSERFLTIKIARIQVLVVVLISTAVNIPRFFLYDIVWRLSDDNSTSLPIVKMAPLAKDDDFDLYYLNIFYSSVILVLPLFVLIFFNVAIIRSIAKSRNRMRKNSMGIGNGRQEKNMTIVMVIIIMELLLCHSLDRVLIVVKRIMRKHEIKIQCPHPIIYYTHVANILIALNSSTDFFIYLIFKKRFRKLLSQLCGCPVKKKTPLVSHRHSSCSQQSNEAVKAGLSKQTERRLGQYRPLVTNPKLDRSQSSCLADGSGAKTSPLSIGSKNGNVRTQSFS